MIRKLLLFLFNIVLLTISYSQTYVSGFINANTTWNLTGSPYIVTGNALVSHGYTLTINPGVVIKFDSAKALQIDGELIAIGTPQNRITFTSNQTNPQAGDWAKLHFADTCENAVFDSFGNYISGCILKYCDVLYGGGIGFGEIHIESSSPYISHCNILNSLSNGIHCITSSSVIDSSNIKNCGGYGLLFSNNIINLLYPLSPKIHNNTIENNSNGGINFYQGSSEFRFISIKNNYFISNNTNGAIYASGFIFNRSIIANNYFINNSSLNGILNILRLDDDTIQCNEFMNNQSNSGGCINVQDPSTGLIANNIFVGNIGRVINIKHEGYYDLYFSNNYIANNSTSSLGVCMFFAQMNNPLTLHIAHNILVNNSGPSTLFISSFSFGSSVNFLYFKHNSFSNPGVQYELDNAIPYGSSNVYADSNYWGGTSTAHIDSVIHDYFDNANLSVVYYLPILNTPIAVDTTCPSDIITDINYREIKSKTLIFPNPTYDHLTICLTTDFSKAEIVIYNILGELEYSSIAEEQNTKIDVSNLRSGMHIIQIKTNCKTEMQKFVIL